MKIALEYSDKFDVKKLSRFAVKGITRICNEIGPRKPGSPEELKAQELTCIDTLDLEPHAYAVNDKITDPTLRNLHILCAI